MNLSTTCTEDVIRHHHRHSRRRVADAAAAAPAVLSLPTPTASSAHTTPTTERSGAVVQGYRGTQSEISVTLRGRVTSPVMRAGRVEDELKLLVRFCDGDLGFADLRRLCRCRHERVVKALVAWGICPKTRRILPPAEATAA